MEFDLPKTAVAFLVVIGIGIGGMFATPMGTDTVLMMVAPSMIVFGLIMTLLGIKHGEYRATN
ncbi:hypothetical protein A6E15_07980 [Natrinema saccharevitans]|uniref:Uncharacterized protein n=1 Tax=Natrinema saccharevitans TaxID=301967 RepID=A0A1S8AX51_9EURY|nr:hypothetical protein [Natrinema saccharevitans]OLZ40934.1 hypothetical protein A6E15_07980 [Natrinema saccharevitans]